MLFLVIFSGGGKWGQHVTVLSEIPEDEIESDDKDDQKVSKSGKDQELEEQAVGQTDESFKECIQMFLDKKIQAGSVCKQNTYMCSNLKIQEE